MFPRLLASLFPILSTWGTDKQLRIRVSEVEDVAEDFQQFQFPELDSVDSVAGWDDGRDGASDSHPATPRFW